MTPGTDLSIHIRKVEDKLSVAVMPRRNSLKEEVQQKMVPLVLSGSPYELDSAFLQAIMQPLQKVQGLLVNAENFEKQAAQAAANGKNGKGSASAESKEAREKREKMEKLLGSDAETFFKSYDAERKFGLRVNPLKLENGEILDPESPLGVYLQGLPKVPWAKEGFYYEAEMRPGRHPFHEAGAYYIQEPSAMSVAEALAPRPGERILDLCAAPGGKSTHLAGKMGGKGLLVCNEIHPARAKILSQNIERLGVGNAVVTNMDPFQLAPAFPEFFDGIVVDAPCSGEGMFRKDENARNEWSPDHVKQCAGLQDGILDCAAKMLKDGGRIAYSTCTFSPEENEQSVARFLSRHPEFSVIRPAIAEYFSAGHPEWADGNPELEKTVRIWPHLADGEGHFLALLVKGESSGDTVTEADSQNAAEIVEKRKKGSRKDNRKDDGALSEAVSAFREFEKENLTDAEELEDRKKFLLFGENLYLVPEMMPDLKGLRVLRPGLHLGTRTRAYHQYRFDSW